MYASIENINKKLTEIVDHVFTICKRHTNIVEEAIFGGDISDEEDKNTDTPLVNSALKILQAIADRLESTTHEKHEFVTYVLGHFSNLKWVTWKFVYHIVLYMVYKDIKHRDRNSLLSTNLTHIFIHIYMKINEDVDFVLTAGDKKQAVSQLGHNMDSFREQTLSIMTVLSELYTLRVDSHAFNHSNEMIYEVFRKLCDLEPILEGYTGDDSDDNDDSDESEDSD